VLPNEGVELKSRNIILWGISYGTPVLTLTGSILLDRGYHIKAAYFDGPFMSPYALVKEFYASILNSVW